MCRNKKFIVLWNQRQELFHPQLFMQQGPFDTYADYVPFVSTATNIVDLALKLIASTCLSEEVQKTDHYFTYLEGKSAFRSMLLLVPVIGNILIGVSDLKYAEWAENSLFMGFRIDDGNKLRMYQQAARYGSVEGNYNFGEMLHNGKGIKPEHLDKPEVRKSKIHALRYAAARGHKDAQNLLGVIHM